MTNAVVTLVAGQLPQGFCFQNPQQFLDAVVAAMSAYLPGTFSSFNYGNATPAPADQNKPWLRLDGSGDLDRIYVFNGAWVSPHAIPPSSAIRWMWFDSPSNLWAWDGGDGTDPSTNAPTNSTGAMWQVDSLMAKRFPFGVGGTYALGDTGGAESNTHYHTEPLVGLNGSGAAIAGYPQTDNTTISIMPPYKACYFIKRTARKFYTV